MFASATRNASDVATHMTHCLAESPATLAAPFLLCHPIALIAESASSFHSGPAHTIARGTPSGRRRGATRHPAAPAREESGGSRRFERWQATQAARQSKPTGIPWSSRDRRVQPALFERIATTGVGARLEDQFAKTSLRTRMRSTSLCMSTSFTGSRCTSQENKSWSSSSSNR